MGAAQPKQFLELQGQPILMWTIRRFYQYDNAMQAVVTLPHDGIAVWRQLCRQCRFDLPHLVVEGGAERFFSVKNALDSIRQTDGLIAVHDGVRPLVSVETIKRCFDKAAQTGAAIPVMPLTESLRYFADSNADNSQSVNRANYKTVQTPQVFAADLLRAAYARPWSAAFTDDASVVEKYGHQVYTVEGNIENIKITTPLDLQIAEQIL
jgi:2-C-methyl-D-erythritol 4-phosphate cytidylyltransferase